MVMSRHLAFRHRTRDARRTMAGGRRGATRRIALHSSRCPAPHAAFCDALSLYLDSVTQMAASAHVLPDKESALVAVNESDMSVVTGLSAAARIANDSLLWLLSVLGQVTQQNQADISCHANKSGDVRS